MDINMKLMGDGEFIAQLRNVADKVGANARKTMTRAADRIEKKAKLQCPRDSGALENSIHQEKAYEGTGGHNRLQIDVVAGGMAPDSEGRMVDTSEYALKIHENYESVHPTPGKNTQAKMDANPGVVIGSKFLERAYRNEEDKLEKEMILVLKETVERGGK